MSTLKVNALQDTSGNNLSRVGQVVETIKKDTASFSTAANTEVNTDSTFSVSITPTSSTSKILILGYVNVSLSDDHTINLVLRAGGSTITDALADAAGSRTRSLSNNYVAKTWASTNIPINYLHSPASTSQQTYSLGLRHNRNSTQSIWINRSEDNDYYYYSRGCSILTVMEILQ